jgi:hypothetical protein
MRTFVSLPSASSAYCCVALQHYMLSNDTPRPEYDKSEDYRISTGTKGDGQEFLPPQLSFFGKSSKNSTTKEMYTFFF